MASIKAYRVMKDNPEWDLQQVATVHDENVYVVKEAYVEEASAAVKKAFEEAVSFCVPTPSDIDVGDNYADAK
jgi:DNA polymerase I-like protein with 3'-5' exonuclease and polymerase domains